MRRPAQGHYEKVLEEFAPWHRGTALERMLPGDLDDLMVEFLEEEMKDLQMRVQMDQMTLVTLASLVTPPLAGVEPGGKDCEEEGEGLESAKSCF